MSVYQQIKLEQLLDKLRLNGIKVGTIELRHLQRIFKTSPQLSRAELSDLLCTVLAHNRQQQQTIQRIFQYSIPFDDALPAQTNKTNKALFSLKKQTETTEEAKESLLAKKSLQAEKNPQAKKKRLNIRTIGLTLLIGISLLLLILAGKTPTPSEEIKPEIINPVIPAKVNNTNTNPNTTEKTKQIISWTAEITSIQNITIWQRLLSPLLLMLGGGLGLIWLLHHAKNRTAERIPDSILITKSGKFHQPKLQANQNTFYLLSPKQRHTMGWGINHYLTEERLQQLDIKKTVAASAKHALPSIHFKKASLQREVWIWVDQSSLNPNLLQLSEEISKTLESLNIDVQQGYFHALPNQVFTQQGKTIWSIDQEPPENQPLVAVLIDSDSLNNLNTSNQHAAETETITLRKLVDWSSLCLIDCSSHLGQLQGIADKFGLCNLMPHQLANWLAQQGDSKKQAMPNCSSNHLYRWACACALPNHPLIENDVRALHEALGLDCAWQFTALKPYTNGFINQLDFSNQRHTLLQNLESKDLDIALDFWQTHYENTDKKLKQLENKQYPWQNSRKQQRLYLNIALLKLWKIKEIEKTVNALHDFYKNKELRGEVEHQLKQYTCHGLSQLDLPQQSSVNNKNAVNNKDNKNNKGILLPFKWQTLPPKTRSLLLSMGFGGSVKQNTLKWDKATAVLLGLLSGITLLGLVWSAQAFIPLDSQFKTQLNSAKPADEQKKISKLKTKKQTLQNNQIAWIKWTKHIRFEEKPKELDE